MGKEKSFNPMELHRKSLKKQELKKFKKQREINRQTFAERADTDSMEKEMFELKRALSSKNPEINSLGIPVYGPKKLPIESAKQRLRKLENNLGAINARRDKANPNERKKVASSANFDEHDPLNPEFGDEDKMEARQRALNTSAHHVSGTASIRQEEFVLQNYYHPLNQSFMTLGPNHSMANQSAPPLYHPGTQPQLCTAYPTSHTYEGGNEGCMIPQPEIGNESSNGPTKYVPLDPKLKAFVPASLRPKQATNQKKPATGQAVSKPATEKPAESQPSTAEPAHSKPSREESEQDPDLEEFFSEMKDMGAM